MTSADTQHDSPESLPAAGVALFDLDGTLIAWDCQLLFRHFVTRRISWRHWLLPVFLAAAPISPLLGCDRMKRLFLSYLWRISPEQLSLLSREFAKQIVPAMYPQLLDIITAHRKRGDLLILSSASPACYVEEIGRLLGFHHAWGTHVEFGPLVPPLPNHKGVAKVVRLREFLPAELFHDGKIRYSHGYSDSSADLPMLELCERVTVVNPKFGFERFAGERGWEIVHPQKPWKSRLDHAIRSVALLLGFGNNPGGLTVRVGKNPETPHDTQRA